MRSSRGKRPAGNLPNPLTRFVGRRREIAETRRLLSRSRLVTLTGVGGVGKTRLAMEAARESRKGFADGVWFVDLAAISDPGQIAQTVATALQVPDQSARRAEEQLAEFLADREVLVLLDNCEHVIEGAAVLAERLLGVAPGLRLLATSREMLDVGGEQALVVHPLPTPDPAKSPPSAGLEASDAVALFLDRARSVLPDFAVTEANHADITRLCSALDGLPLAIELAASRLRTLDVSQIVERLADRFRLLTGGSRTARSRQRTLRALISWSYDLCTTDQQLLWERLSVFAGTFDLAAAEGVCCDELLPPVDLLDLLDGLVSQSVLIVEGRREGDRPRYRLLETIRQFGLELLREKGNHDLLRTRHRDYHLHLAERIAAAWTGPTQATGLQELRACHDNLRVALDWSLSTSSTDSGTAAHRLVTALRYHWCADGFLSEGRRWLDRVLLTVPDDRTVYARTLWVAAWAALLQGDHRIAEQRLDAAHDIATQSEDSLLALQVRSFRGLAAQFRGDLGAAIELYHGALVGFAEGEDDGAALLALFQLALALAHSGDHRAAATAREAIELSTRRGEQLCRSYALWALGYEAWTREDGDAASRFACTGLAIQRNYNDPIGAAHMIELLAWVAASRGAAERAGRLLGAVRALWRTNGTSIASFGPYLAKHHTLCERQVVESVRPERWRTLLEEGSRWGRQRALAEALGERAPDSPDEAGGNEQTPLTPREREVAALVAQGMSNRVIATTLTVSPRTIDGHVENILAKLGFTSRAQVAAWIAGRGEPVRG